MRPRQSTPQPDLVQIRAFKLAEVPKLHLDELTSPTMTLHGYKHLLSEPSTPDHRTGDPLILSTNGIPRSPSAEPATSQRTYHTPTRVRPRSDSRLPSPPPRDVDLTISSPSILSEVGTPTSELGNLQWSSAVGRATTGKSGRVIEKLMGDVDRLQREKNFATSKLEEEVKRGESARSALESLQISNAHLNSIHETDKTFLAKKDRRIEELRADLELERSRREKAEKETRETRNERDEVVDHLQREAAEDRQQAQRANTQYDVLSRSWKSLEERYEKQTTKLREDLYGLQKEVRGDKEKMGELELILEQLIQEGDKSRKIKEKLSLDFGTYKKEQEAGLQEMRHKADMNNTAHDRTLEQVDSLLRQMRYVVNLHKDTDRNSDDMA